MREQNKRTYFSSILLFIKYTEVFLFLLQKGAAFHGAFSGGVMSSPHITLSVIAAATENDHDRKDDDPGAVVIKEIA